MTLQFNALARAVACAALALPASAAIAQATPPAADPHAAVPAARYENPIGYRVDPAPHTTPDQTWVQSNATVAGTNAMSLTMKGMHGAMPQPMHAMPTAPAPATPASTPQPAAPHDHAAMHGDMPMQMSMPMPATHDHHAEDR